MLLSPGQLREHVTSTASDDALRDRLEQAEAEIEAFAGPIGAVEETFINGGQALWLRALPSTVTKVVEGSVTLAADDYALSHNVLTRLTTGTNPRPGWGSTIVSYVTVDDVAIRVGVQISLVQLYLNYAPGINQTTIGSWNEMYSADYETERQRILAPLRAAQPWFA